jgi:hypothetical protein
MSRSLKKQGGQLRDDNNVFDNLVWNIGTGGRPIVYIAWEEAGAKIWRPYVVPLAREEESRRDNSPHLKAQ